MSFHISLLNEKVPGGQLGSDEVAEYAQITIGGFQERLIVPIGYWQKEDYKRQWMDALIRIVNEEDVYVSGIFTEMYDKTAVDFAPMCWMLYRDSEQKDTLLIQNAYLPIDTVKDTQDYNQLYRLIPRYEAPDYSDPHHVSEWSVPQKDIEVFLQSQT